MAEYKIKDLETLTGIKAHTIRIWEKRYGLIAPERTDTMIRTYTDEDLSSLLNIALLNAHGVKISKIASMSSDQILQKVWELRGNHSTDHATEKLIMALIEMDERLFKGTLQDLINAHGLQRTFKDFLIPFLDRIGVMWLVGSINPAQEHFISNLIRQKIISETDKLPTPDTSRPPLLLFLPEHEWHEISLLFYQYVFRSRGINTAYLGQSLPYESLLECIEKLKPSGLVTSWLTSVDEKFIVGYFQRLHKDANGIEIFAGGYQVKNKYNELKEWLIEITDLDHQFNDFAS